MEISIVIPIYNSARSIEELVRRIIRVMEKRSFEIILVDDYSLDDSLKIMQQLTEKDSRILILPLSQNEGQQAATKKGLKMARGDMVITIDDDLEQQPEDIPKLIKEMGRGYDVVYGIANHKAGPFYRQYGSQLVDLFLRLFLDKPKKIKVASFRILNRQTVDYIIKDKTAFVYLTAITLKFTKNIGNIEVAYQERKYGRSNYTIKKLTRLFFKLFYYYRKAS